MKFRSVFILFATFALVACATTSEPERLATPEDPFAMPIPEFMDEQDILIANLREGEPRELDEREWTRLTRIQENITTLVGEASEIEEIDLETRHTLFQLRNQLVAVVLGGAAQDVVCFQMQTTGTRLANKRRCMTRAELEQKRFNAAYIMEYINAQPQGLHVE